MILESFTKDKRNIVIFSIFIIFLLALIFYPLYNGFIILSSFVIFGTLAAFWKQKTSRFLAFVFLLLLSILNIFLYGVKFGIDFSGGTRIPILLEREVTDEEINEIIQTIKSRASVLGLTEIKVRAIGYSQIDVELPASDEKTIKQVEEVLSHQGVFFGVVDGKIAIKGEDILPGTISPIPSSYLRGADWGVGFSVNREGAERFAEVAKDKANYPLYLFLDRPSNSSIFIYLKDLKGDKLVSDESVIQVAKEALTLENDTIELYILDYFSFENASIAERGKKAIVSKNLNASIKEKIKSLGFNLTEVENISPVLRASGEKLLIDNWKAVGLLSAPILSPEVTDGTPSYHYSITGNAEGIGNEKVLNAQKEVKNIISLLKGGSLPVQISVGSKVSIPAPLGKQFLQLSLLALVIAIVSVSILIAIRYHHLRIIAPIIGVSLAELIILISMLGSFTIDVAAMAGILAAIGVGVDAQIVITDELLKRDEKSIEEKLFRALDIIKTNVTVAVVAMIPLLFSGMVEIIGFALSTIIGAILGYTISRPVYAIIAEKILKE